MDEFTFLKLHPPQLDEAEPKKLADLKSHCFKLYHVTSPIAFYKPKTSYMKGGTEPLEYIYVFKNSTEPKHWHYISFGLSDIYNHKSIRLMDHQYRCMNPLYASAYPEPPLVFPDFDKKKLLDGFGFELTMRVKVESEDQPPSWPYALMQKLAGWVFYTHNTIDAGHHISYGKCLDNEEGIIKHMLLTYDPQLTQLGSIKFVQIVGVTSEELEAAREWNVDGILGLMKEAPEGGGNLLVTDMRRVDSIFNLDPVYQEKVREAIKEFGSDLAMVNVRYKLAPSSEIPERNPSRMSCTSVSGMLVQNSEQAEVQFLTNVHLIFTKEAAQVLPTALNQLSHGHMFNLKNPFGDLVTVLIPEKHQSLVGEDRAIAKRSIYLYLYISNDLRKKMQDDFNRVAQGVDTDYSLSWTYGPHTLQIDVVESVDN